MRWEQLGLPFNKPPVAATLRLCSELLKVAFNNLNISFRLKKTVDTTRHQTFFSLILIIILLEGFKIKVKQLLTAKTLSLHGRIWSLTF